jgi:hypothetical protein
VETAADCTRQKREWGLQIQTGNHEFCKFPFPASQKSTKKNLPVFEFGRTIEGGCNETEIEIEVWDFDRWSPDDKIGSLRMKLGELALARGTKIDLSPPLSGCILVRSAEFHEIAGPSAPTLTRLNLDRIRFDKSTTKIIRLDMITTAENSNDAKLQSVDTTNAQTGALVVKVIDENDSLSTTHL